MLINEAANLCNLTKKAVEYYAEQGLICPNIQANGYRDFSAQDIEKLKQIALYRKLDLSIAEIKRILLEPEELKPILCQRTLELEKGRAKQNILQKLCNGESLEDLTPEIDNIDCQAGVVKKLLDLFPSYYGKYISVNFARYLTGEIKTDEQKAAFKEIIDFFDNVPKIEIPVDLQAYLDEYLETYSSEEWTDKINGIIKFRDRNLENIDEFVQNNREVLEKIHEYRKTEEFKNSPANRLLVLMKQICSSNGYYDKFIPAMRRLSPLYNEYYEQMLKANEQFIKNYPELAEWS